MQYDFPFAIRGQFPDARFQFVKQATFLFSHLSLHYLRMTSIERAYAYSASSSTS